MLKEKNCQKLSILSFRLVRKYQSTGCQTLLAHLNTPPRHSGKRIHFRNFIRPLGGVKSLICHHKYKSGSSFAQKHEHHFTVKAYGSYSMRRGAYLSKTSEGPWGIPLKNEIELQAIVSIWLCKI